VRLRVFDLSFFMTASKLDEFGVRAGKKRENKQCSGALLEA
jgi:hypothetical protein